MNNSANIIMQYNTDEKLSSVGPDWKLTSSYFDNTIKPLYTVLNKT